MRNKIWCDVIKPADLFHSFPFPRFKETFKMWIWRRMEKISWLDKVTSEEALRRVNEDRQILNSIWQRKY